MIICMLFAVVVVKIEIMNGFFSKNHRQFVPIEMKANENVNV